MKPRTKLHHKLIEYSNWLTPGIDKKIKQYALTDCNTKFGFSTGKTFWCGVCGDTHLAKEIENNQSLCTTCKSELHIIDTKKRTFTESYYIAFAEDMFEFQVIRYFHISVDYRKGEQWKTEVIECIQQFHTDHEYHIIGRLTHYGADPLFGPMEIRQPSYYKQFAYNPYPSAYHPDSEFLPQYSKKGCSGDIGNINFDKLKRQLNFDYSNTETLLKNKYTSLLKVAISDNYKISKYWKSIKICFRNNYKPIDGSIYIDYLELLEMFGKDIHNPKFICPTDLNKEHNILVAKKRAIREHEEAERRRLQEIENLRKKNYSQKEYKKEKAAFFGLQFKKGKVVIKFLENLREFKKEAETHEHCVYENKYFAKLDSLIFSAYVDGKPTETIEFSLKNMSVIQSRGFKNKASSFNKEIISLINKNIPTIQKRIKQHAA